MQSFKSVRNSTAISAKQESQADALKSVPIRDLMESLAHPTVVIRVLVLNELYSRNERNPKAIRQLAASLCEFIGKARHEIERGFAAVILCRACGKLDAEDWTGALTEQVRKTLLNLRLEQGGIPVTRIPERFAKDSATAELLAQIEKSPLNSVPVPYFLGEAMQEDPISASLRPQTVELLRRRGGLGRSAIRILRHYGLDQRQIAPARRVAETIQFLKDYYDDKPTGLVPRPRDFIRLLADCAQPGRPSLREHGLTNCFTDDEAERFSTTELKRAFGICVAGVRKELAQVNVSESRRCCWFTDALQMVLSDGRDGLLPQWTGLPHPERAAMSRLLEQLGADHERKAGDLTAEFRRENDDEVAVVLKVLKDGRKLREHAALLSRKTESPD